MADDTSKTLDKILDALGSLAKRMAAFEDEKQAQKDGIARQPHEAINGRQPGQADEAARLDSIPGAIMHNRQLREELDRRELLLNRAMREQGPLSERDRAQMGEIQAKFDSVQQGFGKQAPAPLQGESLRMYRARMLNDLRKYHPEFKNAADFSQHDMSIMDAVEPQLLEAAHHEARRPSLDLPEDGSLRKVVRKDEAGRQTIEWYGKNTFIRQFSAPVRKATRFRDAESIALERAINSARH